METKVEKERDYFFDNLRFIFIALVVIGHFISPLANIKSMKLLYRFMYLFHMPGMIFISGYFSKSSVKDGKLVKNKILNYVLLYTIFQIIFTLLNKGKFSIFQSQNGLWYIQILIAYTLLLPIIERMKKVPVLIISVVLGLLVGIDNQAGHVASLSRMLVFLPFFLTGYYCKREWIEKIAKYKYVIFSVIIFGAIIYFLYQTINTKWILELSAAKSSYSVMKMTILEGTIKRAILYIVSLLMCISLMIITPKKKTFFSKFGARTLQIFCLHLIVVILLRKTEFFIWLKQLKHIYAIGIILSTSIGVTFILGTKVFSYPFDWIMKCKFKHLLKNPEVK